MGIGSEYTIQEVKEWMIQRCTQGWVGSALEYEDFPTPEGTMTRDLMLRVLERVSREHPDDEFRGHRVVPKRSAR
jgi:hypothetical protein